MSPICAVYGQPPRSSSHLWITPTPASRHGTASFSTMLRTPSGWLEGPTPCLIQLRIGHGVGVCGVLFRLVLSGGVSLCYFCSMPFEYSHGLNYPLDMEQGFFFFFFSFFTHTGYFLYVWWWCGVRYWVLSIRVCDPANDMLCTVILQQCDIPYRIISLHTS